MEDSANDLSTIGGRIRSFYHSKGLSRPEFAKKLQIPYDRLSSYERNRAEPNSGFFLAMLAEFPDVDIGWIMTGSKTQVLSPVEISELEIPVVEEITAGGLTLFLDQSIVGRTVTTNTKDKDLFGLKVRGDSMFPEVQEGDIVICAPHRGFVNGKIYAVTCAGGETTIKRVWKRTGGYELVPTNSEFTSTFVDDDQMCRLVRIVQIQRTA